MNLTLSVDDDVVQKARQRADQLGTSLNQLVRDYLAQLAVKPDSIRDAEEFERLSQLSQGNSQGWSFNRDEVHERQ